MKRLFVLLAAAACIAACTTGPLDGLKGYYESDIASGDYSAPGEGGGSQGGGSIAGIITAGEWCDLDHWAFWGNLAAGSFSNYLKVWGFNTAKRVAVEVRSGEEPVCGAKVELFKDGQPVWQAVSDNHGRADCWVDAFDMSGEELSGELKIAVNGQTFEESPSITWLQDKELKLNEYAVSDAAAPTSAADIAFIVDATGSMSDEISFLKSDVTDIIGKVKDSGSGLSVRTAAVFYRDKGDKYLTKVSAFTDDLDKTAKFISEQEADGGGDFPEAVHSALEASLQSLDWKEDARTRLAFIILDARAHHEPEVHESLHKSIATYASKDIKLIPVAASGIDKDTEAMCRVMDIFTGGTYVFITNDSGVGGEHIEASVGDYQVEKLNSLLIRLINYYTE